MRGQKLGGSLRLGGVTCRYSRISSLVVNTGSGHKLLARSGPTNREKEELAVSKHPLRLRTASGVIAYDDVTISKIARRGNNVTARVLENALRVLSVQQVIENDCASFSWYSIERTAFQ